jgi:hypothetical protein
MTIEAELNKVLKVKRKKGEDEQLYLARMVTTVQHLSEEAWETLSIPAQRWCNSAAKAFDAKQDIKGFDDDEEEEVQQPKSNGKGKAAKAEAKAAKSEAKAETVKAAKPAKAPKKVSMSKTLKGLVIENPSFTVEELSKALNKAGFEGFQQSTVVTCRTDLRDTLRYLQDHGHLARPMI